MEDMILSLSMFLQGTKLNQIKTKIDIIPFNQQVQEATIISKIFLITLLRITVEVVVVSQKCPLMKTRQLRSHYMAADIRIISPPIK